MATHSLTCRGCGNQFESARKRAYCRVECYPTAPKRHALTCCDCGCGFTSGKGRTPKRCRQCADGRKAGIAARRDARKARLPKPKMASAERYASAVCRTEHKCQGCGEGFTPRSSDRTKFCSRACAYAHQTMWQGQSPTAVQAARMRALARVADTLRVRVSVQMNLPMYGPPTPRRCACGQCVGKWSRLCLDCWRERKRASRRICRAARKSAVRRAVVERFDPLDVLRRDGWLCHMCGRKTPSKLRGSHKPNAPELDHIIPIAAGGEHSRLNTACACRACNIAKGAKVMGQASLLALI